MFAVIFTIGRTPGWISQWMEMREHAPMKIVRPRQIYVGPKSGEEDDRKTQIELKVK